MKRDVEMNVAAIVMAYGPEDIMKDRCGFDQFVTLVRGLTLFGDQGGEAQMTLELMCDIEDKVYMGYKKQDEEGLYETLLAETEKNEKQPIPQIDQFKT